MAARGGTLRDGLTVVTLSYLRPDLFCRMADSLPRSEAVVEAILVNNGGDADTRAAAAARGWTVVEPGRNLSFSAGNNLGVRASCSSHVLLLNNDAVLRPHTIDALWARRGHPLVGCVIVQSDGRVNHAGGALHGRSLLPYHLDRGADPATVTADRYTPWTTFACAMIARPLWDALGGLDEAYVYCYEDVDFGLRAFERGVPSLIAHDAVVQHDECGTRSAATSDRNIVLWRDRWLATGRLARLVEIARGGR